MGQCQSESLRQPRAGCRGGSGGRARRGVKQSGGMSFEVVLWEVVSYNSFRPQRARRRPVNGMPCDQLLCGTSPLPRVRPGALSRCPARQRSAPTGVSRPDRILLAVPSKWSDLQTSRIGGGRCHSLIPGRAFVAKICQTCPVDAFRRRSRFPWANASPLSAKCSARRSSSGYERRSEI